MWDWFGLTQVSFDDLTTKNFDEDTNCQK